MEQHTLKGTASNVQVLATNKYKQATLAVDGYVSDNPWKAIGIMAAVGVLIGFMTARL